MKGKILLALTALVLLAGQSQARPLVNIQIGRGFAGQTINHHLNGLNGRFNGYGVNYSLGLGRSFASYPIYQAPLTIGAYPIYQAPALTYQAPALTYSDPAAYAPAYAPGYLAPQPLLYSAGYAPYYLPPLYSVGSYGYGYGLGIGYGLGGGYYNYGRGFGQHYGNGVFRGGFGHGRR